MQLLADELPHVEFLCSATIPDVGNILDTKKIDLLLLDLFMPGGNYFAALRRIRLGHPKLPILVLSSAPEEQLGGRALRAGANGYLDKQAAPKQLVHAALCVLKGENYVSPALAQQIALEVARGNSALHESLSEREFQVMSLIVAGRPLKEIANALSLSVKTIRTFHTRILGKLHLQSDVDLVHYALDHGLIEKSPPPNSI
jgi:DNA-binding NarL/FixJ family response regulator